MMHTDRYFYFLDTVLRSKRQMESFLPASGNTQDIPILLDLVAVRIPVLHCQDLLEINSLFIENVTGHLWNHIVTNEHLFRAENIWIVKLISHREHFFVTFKAHIRSFYTIEHIHKLHKTSSRNFP